METKDVRFHHEPLIDQVDAREEYLISRLDAFFRRIGVPLGEEAAKKLYIYALELWRWNRAYNLISRKLDWDGLVDLIIDSLTPLSIKGLLQPGITVLDVGSGAGMPGIPLLICSGGFNLDLLEPVRKKVTFMRHAIRTLSLEGALVVPFRLEALLKDRKRHDVKYDLVLSRAAMSPIQILYSSAGLLNEHGRAVIFVGPGDIAGIKRESVKLSQHGIVVKETRSVTRLTGKEKFLVIANKI